MSLHYMAVEYGQDPAHLERHGTRKWFARWSSLRAALANAKQPNPTDVESDPDALLEGGMIPADSE